MVVASGVLAFLFPVLHALTYNDLFTRNKVFPMSAAAYSADPSDCVKNIFGNGGQVIVTFNFVDLAYL